MVDEIISRKKKRPEDYLGSQKDIWQNIDVAKYLAEERDLWSQKIKSILSYPIIEVETL